MLGYKQMNRSSSLRLASEGYGSQRKFHLSSYISRPSEKKYWCARGMMPKTSVGIMFTSSNIRSAVYYTSRGNERVNLPYLLINSTYSVLSYLTFYAMIILYF